MGFTYKIESKTLNSNYAGDAVLKIYNQEGKIIAEYDGPVKDTSLSLIHI